MVSIKNKLNQPVVINIPEGDSIIFLAKETKDLTNDQFNAPEMQNHVDKGNMIVLRMND